MEDDGGPIKAITRAALSPFEDLARRRQNWRMLDEVEKNLRRAGQGIALAILTVVVAFYIYGLNGLGRLFVDLVTDPGKGWPGAIFICLIVYGLVRGIAGARRLTGVRDGLRASAALLKLALSVAVMVYLWRGSWPREQLGDSVWMLGGLAVIFTIAFGCAITGTVRFLALTIGGSNALTIIERDLARRNAPLQSARRRPWWKRG